jgi:hypothetical protein
MIVMLKPYRLPGLCALFVIALGGIVGCGSLTSDPPSNAPEHTVKSSTAKLYRDEAVGIAGPKENPIRYLVLKMPTDLEYTTTRIEKRRYNVTFVREDDPKGRRLNLDIPYSMYQVRALAPGDVVTFEVRPLGTFVSCVADWFILHYPQEPTKLADEKPLDKK